MAHRLGLGQARQTDRIAPLDVAQAALERLGFLEIDARRLQRADLENQRLLDLQAAIAGIGVQLAGPLEGFPGHIVHASTFASAAA